jgi:hypothetical protein
VAVAVVVSGTASAGAAHAVPAAPVTRHDARAALPRVTWLPDGYRLMIHEDSPRGPIDIYRTMTERDRIEKLHAAPIGSVAISPAPAAMDRLLALPHDTVRSGGREYLVFTDAGPIPQLAVVWPAGGVQVVTTHLSQADTVHVVDGLVAS